MNFPSPSGVRLLVLLALSAFASSCSTPQSAPKTPPARITNVAIYPLRPDSLTRYSELPATALAWRDVTIAALESGVVSEIHADLGDRVAFAQILARQRADLLGAAVLQAEAELKFQNYNNRRANQLYKEGSISEHERMTAEFDQARAEAGAISARTRLSYLEIRAPFNGKIAERSIERGQLVPPGGSTFRLVQTDTIKVQAWVPENQIADFTPGGQVEIRFDAYPNEVFPGTVGRIGPAAQSSRRVFPLEAYLLNPNDRIQPGLIGKLRAVRRIYRNALVIPREAVLERETGPAAFVVLGDSVQMRQLTLGPSSGGRVLATGGLFAGDQLVVRGGRDLINGDRVRVTEVLDP
ncbi:MAG: efflux RND transporter periplasmic adaptor subunit [bacterium]|nr:efflux RND transporter periplasmic adaptor subunit [bacterium]